MSTLAIYPTFVLYAQHHVSLAKYVSLYLCVSVNVATPRPLVLLRERRIWPVSGLHALGRQLDDGGALPGGIYQLFKSSVRACVAPFAATCPGRDRNCLCGCTWSMVCDLVEVSRSHVRRFAWCISLMVRSHVRGNTHS